ncbi:MAG: hypothetical protein K0S01_3721 [Herbinix sp.]|jgi:hypothetical protein|nr:hypothetical protein [Herbinix sp.]
MIKRKLSAIVLAILLIFPVATYLDGNVTAEAAGVSINSIYTTSVSTYLSISSSGASTAICEIKGDRNLVTKVSIYAYLQQYVNGSWITTASDSGQLQSYSGTLIFNSNVIRGYQYRVMVNYYAFAGSNSEYTQDFSNIVTY